MGVRGNVERTGNSLDVTVGRMDGWMDEWTDGLHNECTNGWINRQMDG